jgi:hypothetical protein
MMRRAIQLLLLLVLAALPVAGRAAPEAAVKPSPNVFMFVAAGPAGEADLARLREALAKIARVTKVEAHAGGDGAILAISVDGEAPMSLLAAAGKSVGFVVRPAPTRSYVATGPTGDADLTRLREALGKVPDAGQIELDPQSAGAALRITGAATTAALAAAGKAAGFALRQLGSYVVSGPSAPADLARLRVALGNATGVEAVELHGLTGGATLLIYGDVKEAALVRAAKAAGYALWPLSDAARPREFRVGGSSGAATHQKLREAVQSVDGIGELEIRTTSDGARLVVTGGRTRPEAIITAATAAGFALTPVETVALPSLEPQAGRGTPPDFDERVLEELTKPGEPAPDFTLLSKDGQTTLRLSDYRGKKPVILMFGSCT